MTFTHRLKRNESYYRTGPQQSAPADGTFAQGTRCALLDERSGSYVRIRAEDGRVGYVAKSALVAIDEMPGRLITYKIESDTDDGLLKGAARIACSFWNRFLHPRRSIVLRLGVFTRNGQTIAEAWEPHVHNKVVYGKVQFNTKYLKTFSNYQTAGTLVHEIAHTLGFGWADWAELFDAETGEFTAAAVKKLKSLSDMRVELEYGDGTELAHWDEERFTAELMTGFKDEGPEHVLPVTIDVMGLLGHEVVERLEAKTSLDDLLQHAEKVLFSRRVDVAKIDLDVRKETPLWETLTVPKTWVPSKAAPRKAAPKQAGPKKGG